MTDTNPLITSFFSGPCLYEKSRNYDGWVNAGLTLASMAKYRNVHPVECLDAFLKFSRFGREEAEIGDQTLVSRFNYMLQKVRTDMTTNIAPVSFSSKCNTLAEYLSLQVVSTCDVTDLKKRLGDLLGDVSLIPYYLVCNCGCFREYRFYQTLFSCLNIDLSSCFEYSVKVLFENFSKIATHMKLPDCKFDSRVFSKVDFWLCQRTREVLLQMTSYDTFTIFPCTDLCHCAIMETLLTIAKKDACESLWTTQFPYHSSLSELLELSNGDCKLFQLLVVAATENIFILEPYLHFFSYVSTDLKAAEVIYELYPYWRLSVTNELYVFNDNSGLWSKDKSVQISVIQRLTNLLSKPATKTSATPLADNYGATNNLSDKALARISSLYNVIRLKKEFDDMKNSSIGKLLFPNGYYDGSKMKFMPAMHLHKNHLFPRDSFLFTKPDLYFFANVPDNYIQEYGEGVEAEKERMKDILFYRMHGKEIGDYHLESLSLALFGEKYKGFYVHVGDTNSGKSTEKALIEASFGEYCGTGNTDDFGIIKNDQREAVLINSFVVDNWYKRAVFYSEKGQRVLNTEMLKSMSSGGEDLIRGRKQYGVPSLYQIHFKMFFYVNEGLVVNNPNDIAYIDRARYFYWTKSFVPKDHIVDPESQLERLPEVQEWKNDKCRRQLFVRIIIDSYIKFVERKCHLPIPEAVQLSTREEVGHALSIDETFEKLMYGFIFTGNPAHFVDRDTINQVCEKLALSAKKCTIRINAVIAKLGFDTIRSDQKKIRGQKHNIWVGVIPRPHAHCFVDENSGFVDFNNWCETFKHFKGCIPDEVVEAVLHYQNLDQDSEYYKFCSPAQKNVIARIPKKGKF